MSISVLKMLSIKGVDWSAPGRGGFSELCKSDIAAALGGGLSKEPYNLALFLFMGDEVAEAALAQAIRAALISAGVGADSVELDGLTRSVMAEFFDKSRCSACKGSGQVIRKVPLNTSDTHRGGASKSMRRELAMCQKCDGRGVSRWTAYRQAKEAGINERSYSRLYLAARTAGYRSVRSWMGELTSHLTTRLQD